MKKTSKKHVFHMRRIGLFGVLFAAFFIVRSDAGALPATGHTNSQVLAYATEMSRSGLLSGTNAARSANGLASLALNAKLNNSAQAKAQDMANKNYWAHVSPDGTEPWYFFDQAGYTYVRAGENLAYGFMTSQGAVDGWMNSPSHKANMLGDYYDVGFGIVNSPDYQSSGQQTIVVAHYGTEAMAPAAPAPAPASPTPNTQGSTQSSPSPYSPSPELPTTPTPTPVNESSPETPAAPVPATESMTPSQTAAAPIVPVKTNQPLRLSVLSMVASRTAPIAALISLVMVCISITGYALTHRAALHHAVSNGEHFVATHPGIDAGIVAAMTTLILLTSYGNIG